MLRMICLFLLVSTLTGCASSRPAIADVEHPLARFKYSCQPFDSLEIARLEPELEELYGKNLTADKYRPMILAALSFYPELRHVKIELRRQPLKTSMAARPLGLSLVRRKRKYAIYVDDTREDKPTDFRDYPYSARIGCFIHELGHISHYETRSNASLFGNGVAYVTNQKFKSEYERIADRKSIEHGGGYYVYLFRNHTLNEAPISRAYRAFKRANYDDEHTLLRKHLDYLAAESIDRCNSVE